MNAERAKEVRTAIIDSAILLASSLSTSLGPKGSDKMIIKDKKTLITNDGATILKNLSYSHPINKILCDVSQTQDRNCGDGTTSVIILIGGLLKRCNELLKKEVHPSTIVRAIDDIKKMCIAYIDEISIHISDKKLNKERYKLYFNQQLEERKNYDEMGDFKDFYVYRDSLLKSAITSLSSKIVSLSTVEFAPVAVDAVLQVKGDLSEIKLIKKIGKAVEDIKMTQSIVLKQNLKNNPNIIAGNNEPLSRKVKMAIFQFCISPPKPNIDSKIDIDNQELMERIIKEEREYLLDICKKIKKSGTELVILQKSILRESCHELALHFLTKLNVLVIDNVERDEIAFLIRKFNIKPTVDADYINTVDCSIQEQDDAGWMITEIACEGGCSIIIRGSDQMLIDEAERSLHDALCVVRCLFEDPHLLPGGGAVEIGMANRLFEKSLMGNKEVLGEVKENEVKKVESCNSYILCEFSRAFEEIPYYLAKNAGMNAIQVISELKNSISANPYVGIDVRRGSVGNMIEENVVQPVKVSKSALSLALETVAFILKIDDILPSK